jgi:hypothetical protein
MYRLGIRIAVHRVSGQVQQIFLPARICRQNIHYYYYYFFFFFLGTIN